MGIARLVKAAWIGVSGVARQFWPSVLDLHDLALGSTVVYNSKKYTVIAKDYIASGDTILWDVAMSYDGFKESSTSSPFGASNTNNATVYYYRNGSKGTITGYGWMVPAKALGSNLSQGSPAMPYFSSNEQRKRATACWCPDWNDTDDENAISDNYRYINTSGAITGIGYFANKWTSKADTYWAYSVKGTLNCSKNSDGTYTLTI